MKQRRGPGFLLVSLWPAAAAPHQHQCSPGFTPGLVSQEELAGQFLAGTDEVGDEGGLLLLSFDEQLF